MKKTNKTQVSDLTQLKQKLKEAKNEIKQLKQENKKLVNQKKEMQKIIDGMEKFIDDYTEHVSIEEVLRITKKRKIKTKSNKAEELKKELREAYGRKKA